MKRSKRTDFSPTLENIDIGLSQLADLIERFPEMDCLWLYVDRLEAEKLKLIVRQDWLNAVRSRSRNVKETRQVKSFDPGHC